jgi:hypothetical protein
MLTKQQQIEITIIALDIANTVLVLNMPRSEAMRVQLQNGVNMWNNKHLDNKMFQPDLQAQFKE